MGRLGLVAPSAAFVVLLLWWCLVRSGAYPAVKLWEWAQSFGVGDTLADLALANRPFLPGAIEWVQILDVFKEGTDIVPGLWVPGRDSGKDVEDWGGDVLRLFIVKELNRE